MESRCWYCSKCFGECSWSALYRPVTGWVAVRNDLVSVFGKEVRIIKSYIVLSCPLFSLDPKFAVEYEEYQRSSVAEMFNWRLGHEGD